MTDQSSIYRQYIPPPPPKPDSRTIARHLLLLLITFCTTMTAGTLYPFGPITTLPEGDPQTFSEFLTFLYQMPEKYIGLVGTALSKMFTDPGVMADGVTFACSLLFILFCHEMGHYIACRIYRVDATLPFFLPTPPLIGPAGTFGAFIKIRAPMPSRRAVFDIGVAGPLAGFIALLPIAVWGIATMQTATPVQIANSSGELVFGDPLLMRFIAYLFGIDLNFGVGNSFYYAAWVGVLVTALNLIPAGQLDGGHALFAVFGRAVHQWSGRIAFAAMALLSIAGAYFYSSPSGFLIAVILAVMMKVGHPTPLDDTPLDAKRKLVALITLAIFVLCFVPFPIQIN